MRRINHIIEILSTAALLAVPAAFVLAATPNAEFFTHLNAGTRAYESKDYATAEAELSRAVKLAESFKQPDNWLAQALNDLSLVYDAEHKLQEAEDASKRAIDIRGKALG
ncbi:MAG: tetratricopeptide repeat protein [Terriglobales bacterium]